MSRVRSLSCAAGAALALLLASCSSEAPPAPPPPEVNIVTIRTQTVPNVIELPGRVQAYRTSEVRAASTASSNGACSTRAASCAPGPRLFRIDPRQLTATANAARAQLARAQATAANARQVVGRYQPLLADQAIGKQEYDAAVAAQRTAEADVQAGAGQSGIGAPEPRLFDGDRPHRGRARRAE